MKTIAAMLMLALMAGCASVGRPIKTESISKIQKGKTTQSQILAEFGNPFQTVMTDDGKTKLIYTYIEARSNARNCIPIVNLFSMKVETETNQLQILLDENDVVENYIYTDNTSTSKSGLL